MRYHILGINISVLLHTALIALVFYAGHSFSPPRKSVALDFSILKSASGQQGAPTENQRSAGTTAAARPKATAPNPDQAALKPEKLPPRDVLQKKAPASRSDKRPEPSKKKAALRTSKPKAKPKPLPKVMRSEGYDLRKTALEENTSRDLSTEKTPSRTNIKENDDPVDTVPEPRRIHTIEDQQVVPSPDIYDLADILPRQGEPREGETGVKEEFTARGIHGAPPDTNLENAADIGGGGDGMAAYYSAIRTRLRDRLHYPPIARARGYAGKVIVSFTVYRNGTVQDLKIRKSCGVSILDKSALKTVKAACPFPRPSQMAKIVIPIVYSFN